MLIHPLSPSSKTARDGFECSAKTNDRLAREHSLGMHGDESRPHLQLHDGSFSSFQNHGVSVRQRAPLSSPASR